MAQILPFRGVLYNGMIVGDTRKVVAPPYDVIDTQAQQGLYDRHPYNVIRLELGKEEPTDGPSDNRYTRAAQDLRNWLEGTVLVRDAEPAIYPYTVEYRSPSVVEDAGQKVLKGFFCLVKLEEFGPGRVLPHETTRAAAKTDRLNLLESCRANFSPIFSLFSDPRGLVASALEKSMEQLTPRVEFVDDDGFRHRLWSITDTRLHQTLAQSMVSQSLFIADGHHRYETALTFRELQRTRLGADASSPTQPWDAVLMLCASLEDPGLTVLPTHRVLSLPLPSIKDVQQKLDDEFEIKEVPFAADPEPQARARFLHLLHERGRERTAFGLVLKGASSYFLLTQRAGQDASRGESPRDRLDVSVLHRNILGRLSLPELTEKTVIYTKDANEAIELVREGHADAAFLLNPTKVSEVSDVASAGERMPHKSTYFFPKPLTGLVMHVMGDDHDEREPTDR